jgi:hypothetical protein
MEPTPMVTTRYSNGKLSLLHLQSIYFIIWYMVSELWPAATNVVALHPHQIYQTSFELYRKVPPCTGQKGINSNPLLDHPCRSGNIFAIYKTIAAKKLRRKVIQLLTSFESSLGLIRKC